jgi:hypothetical protein
MTISDEMKNKQRGQLRRTRIPRLVLLILVIFTMDFLDHFEPFQSNFWIVFLISVVAATVGCLFILWIDSKRQSLAGCKGITTSK